MPNFEGNITAKSIRPILKWVTNIAVAIPYKNPIIILYGKFSI
jgi:hypothetical protein